jgi:hypothetical protein
MLKQNELESLKKWAENLLKDDFDKFDFNSEIDKSLTLSENKTILREKLKVFLREIPTKAEMKNEIQKREYEQIQEIKKQEQLALKEFELTITQLKKSEECEVIEKYKTPIEFIKSVVKGDNKAFIFLGSCGLGKSYLTRQILAKENAKFIESRGVCSPLGLYQFLYENNDENLTIVFDDVSGLLENPNANSLLLGILWGGTASWNSTSGKLKIPKQFIFNGKIVVIANKLKGDLSEFIDKLNNSDIIKSRCLTYTIDLTKEELIEMMYNIAKLPHKKLTKEERFAIVDFIKDNSSRTLKGLDLRTQVKAENLYLYDKGNWKALVLPLLPKCDILDILDREIKGNNSIKEACARFCEETGACRRTFYNLKKKYYK